MNVYMKKLYCASIMCVNGPAMSLTKVPSLLSRLRVSTFSFVGRFLAHEIFGDSSEQFGRAILSHKSEREKAIMKIYTRVGNRFPPVYCISRPSFCSADNTKRWV